MSKVIFITEQVAKTLAGTKYAEDCYFMPVQDKIGNWCISEEEIRDAKGIFVGAKLNLTTSRAATKLVFDKPVVPLPWEKV